MVVAITGATGLLGRNLLFECLRRYRHHLGDLEVLLFARPGKVSLSDRIAQILQEDGLSYLGLPVGAIPMLMSRMRFYAFHLEQEDLSLDSNARAGLRRYQIDHFFHVAADVDFRDTPSVRRQLQVMNVDGTRRVVDLCRQLHIGSFAYVSTAYVSGLTTGRIAPDFLNPAGTFKNPYEASKLEAEILVRESFAAGTTVSHTVFRPSTICGRLLEDQPGQTSKFDVFYAWTAFFLRMKAKILGRIDYDSPAELDIRIAMNTRSGLNIVPADYAAKVMLEVEWNGRHSDSFHLVAPEETNWPWLADQVLRFLNIATPPYVSAPPLAQNFYEQLYYQKTVGRIYTPYMTLPPVEFDLHSTNAALPPDFPGFPLIDQEKLNTLLQFARKHNFGLTI